jgi:hypothetical protein
MRSENVLCIKKGTYWQSTGANSNAPSFVIICNTGTYVGSPYKSQKWVAYKSLGADEAEYEVLEPRFLSRFTPSVDEEELGLFLLAEISDE